MATHTINGVTTQVSGKTAATRAANPVFQPTDSRATHTINGITTGVSGRTAALRAAAAGQQTAQQPIAPGSNQSGDSASNGSGPNGGGGTTTPASPGKSGKTLAARAQQEFFNNIVHYAILFGLAIGAYVIVKKVVFGKKRKGLGGGK